MDEIVNEEKEALQQFDQLREAKEQWTKAKVEAIQTKLADHFAQKLSAKLKDRERDKKFETTSVLLPVVPIESKYDLLRQNKSLTVPDSLKEEPRFVRRQHKQPDEDEDDFDKRLNEFRAEQAKQDKQLS